MLKHRLVVITLLWLSTIAVDGGGLENMRTRQADVDVAASRAVVATRTELKDTIFK